MTTAIQTVDQKALALANAVPTSGAPYIGAGDVLIPKILVIQKMSEKADDKNSEAEVGDLRDTANDEKFGDLETPMEFIPVAARTFWAEYELDKKSGKKGDWIQNMDITPENDKLPYKDGDIIRDRTHEIYVLLPEQIAAGVAFPYILSFRVSSLKGGQAVLTQMFVKNRDAGKPPWHAAMKLSLHEESNDDGSFIVQRCKLSRAATDAEKIEAHRWAQIIGAGGTRTDDSDLKQKTASTTAASVNSDKF